MKKKLSVRDITLVGMCAALMAIFSQLSIPLPFTTVPLTLQTFGVVIIAIILEHKLGTLTMLIWTLVGAIGLPVFAGFSGGFSVVIGPTGGYIIGFIIMAFIVGYAASKDNKVVLFAGVYLGQAIQYTCGVLQMKVVLGLGMHEALVAGLYPFILKGIIEVALAAMIALLIKKNLGKVLNVNVAA